jgi:SAM-dependent methyltransferase
VTRPHAALDCQVCGGQLRPWPLDRRNSVDRCERCGLVLRDLVAAPAGARSPAYGGDPDLDRVRLTLTYRRLRRLVPGRGARVFEVGFGTGALLRRFLDDGATVAGADPGLLEVDVDPAVAAAGDLASAPLAARPGGASHDLVLGVHVIEHVADLAGFAAACRALLRPGGRLVLLTPAGDGAGLGRFRSRWWMLEDPTHVRFLTADSARLLLEGAGLVDVRVRRLVLDSVGVEAASLVRALRWRNLPPAGVLSWPATRLLVLVTAPVVLAVRLLVPSTRPTLEVTARCPDPHR